MDDVNMKGIIPQKGTLVIQKASYLGNLNKLE